MNQLLFAALCLFIHALGHLAVGSDSKTVKPGPQKFQNAITNPSLRICSELSDLSTAFLWNEVVIPALEEINPYVFQRNDENHSTLLRKFQQPTQLRHAIATRPISAWGRMLKRASNTSKLVVWVLGRPEDVDSCSTSNIPSCNSTWVRQLQAVLPQLTGVAIQWNVVALSDASTASYTNWYRSAIDGLDKEEPLLPDIIIHALARHDLASLDTKKAREDGAMSWEHQQRDVLQSFLRPILQQQCSSSKNGDENSEPPIVVFLDDFLPTLPMVSDSASKTALWLVEANSRVISQLANYYDTSGMGLISFSSFLRRWSYFHTEDGEVLIASRNERGKAVYSELGHHLILITLLFSSLEYTLSYCSSSNIIISRSNQKSNLLDSTIQKRIVNVLPPPLSEESSLLTVSEEWARAEEEARTSCYRERDI